VQTLNQIRSMYRTLGEPMQTQDGTPLCMFNVIDRNAFDAVTAGDYTVRYITADVTLEAGDSVMINGAEYVLPSPPLQINAQESVAGLVLDD
jgi:hypothetical protein